MLYKNVAGDKPTLLQQREKSAAVILEPLKIPLSVYKVTDYSKSDIDQPFVFSGSNDHEKSLVCQTKIVHDNIIVRDDGWKAFRICGELDFSLIGILTKVSKVLAENAIGIFAISTYNTDYILTKEENCNKAL